MILLFLLIELLFWCSSYVYSCYRLTRTGGKATIWLFWLFIRFLSILLNIFYNLYISRCANRFSFVSCTLIGFSFPTVQQVILLLLLVPLFLLLTAWCKLWCMFTIDLSSALFTLLLLSYMLLLVFTPTILLLLLFAGKSYLKSTGANRCASGGSAFRFYICCYCCCCCCSCN